MGVIITVTMLDKTSNDETLGNPENEKRDYVRLFEERIERLAPLPEYRTVEIAEKFGLDKIGLYPVKFVASVLYAPPRRRS